MVILTKIDRGRFSSNFKAVKTNEEWEDMFLRSGFTISYHKIIYQNQL